MSELWGFVQHHGYALLFAAVLIEQLGAPVPAAPVLVIMGTLAGVGHFSLTTSLALAVVASLMADYLWFYLGQVRGDRVLRLLCRISLEPDSCVRQANRVFGRWGGGTLILAKFIPGLGTVAPPMAGITRMPWWRFVLSDGLGAILWAGSALLLGRLFRPQAERIMNLASQFGSGVLAALFAPLAAYVLWKYIQRRKFIHLLRVARIKPEELLEQLGHPDAPLVVDLRAPAAIERSGARLPGAVFLRPGEVEDWHTSLARDRGLVFYCS